MPPTRLQRSGASLDELRESIRSEFGPSARIVAAEKVTSGGLGGLFRKHHYEATVEVPDPNDTPSVRVAIAADRSTRAGILALLEDAEDAEDRLAAADGRPADGRSADGRPADGRSADARAADARAAADDLGGVIRRGRRAADLPVDGPGAPGLVAGASELVPTEQELAARSDTFASIMDDFTFNGLAPTGSLADALEGRGSVHAGGGSGLQSGTDEPLDPRAAFEAIAIPAPETSDASGASVRPGGPGRVPEDGSRSSAPAIRRTDGDLVAVVGRAADAAVVADLFERAHGLRVVEVADRRAAILARAAGVQEGCGSVVAVPWPRDVRGSSMVHAAALEGIGPDQVWVVVDAGRKHEDTAREVRSVAAAVPIAGLVVIGAGETSTPDTVHLLGVPVLDARSLG